MMARPKASGMELHNRHNYFGGAAGKRSASLGEEL